MQNANIKRGSYRFVHCFVYTVLYSTDLVILRNAYLPGLFCIYENWNNNSAIVFDLELPCRYWQVRLR